MKNRNLSFVLLSLALLALSGCAKDRTLDDYNREKVSEHITRMQAVAGTYRGVLNLGSAALGNASQASMILEVKPDISVNTSRDAHSTEPQASLEGTVTLNLGDGNRLTTFQDGYYDETTGDFKAEVKIAQRSGDPVTVSLQGTFGNQAVTGTIEATGFSEAGGQFNLTQNGALPEPGSSSGAAHREPGGELSRQYAGSARFVHGDPARLEMTVLSPHATLEQEFLDVLVPLKWVNVTLVLNGRSPVVFANARWDLRTGILYGQSLSQGGNPRDQYEVVLRCTVLPALAPATEAGWRCSYWSNHMGVVFTSDLMPATSAAR